MKMCGKAEALLAEANSISLDFVRAHLKEADSSGVASGIPGSSTPGGSSWVRRTEARLAAQGTWTPRRIQDIYHVLACSDPESMGLRLSAAAAAAEASSAAMPARL